MIFGAPGSLIQNNHVVAISREALGGINLVDYAPTNGNYIGTRVIGNVVEGRSAFIKMAIAMGPQIWNLGARITVQQLRTM